MDLQQTLLALELQLLAPDIRRSRPEVAALLCSEFREIGCSGRSYSRKEILDRLANETAHAIQIEQFTVKSLGPEAALALYTSVHGSSRAHRSSVWVRREGRWLMPHHQGTAF